MKLHFRQSKKRAAGIDSEHALFWGIAENNTQAE